MADSTTKPVILLAFANDRDDTVGYLRNLPNEARQIREPLQRARRDGLCELVELANVTADDIFRVFQDAEYRDRIAVFHYGGHANGYQLLLESADGKTAAADAGGLASFLGQQAGLDLVFLNGCSTSQQVQGLLDANVAAVIATSRDIEDQVATEFARLFYQGLAGGANLRTAYHEAEAAIETTKGGDKRALYFGDVDSRTDASNDRFPWELNLRDGAEVVANWSLPEAVGDPLFGLPALPQQDLPPSPFRHLSWFDREHAELFFGRGHQIREVYDLVSSAGTAPIVLLYGQSGVGKSSMLAAGLIPRLEHGSEVRYLRRDRDLGLVETLRNAFVALGGSTATKETVHFTQDWIERENQLGKPLVIILDQIEEVFTLPNPEWPHELDDFLNLLEETFGDRQSRPQGRLILGFRKEWLAEFEERLLARKLPRAKVFLDRLGRRGVIEAVLGPTKSQRLTDQYRLTVEDGLPEIIADDLLEDAGSAIAPTLQILLTKMWQEAVRLNEDRPHFNKDLYQSLKRDGVLLRDFLLQQLDQLGARLPQAMESGLLLDVLSLHTTSLGTADQRSVEQLVQQYGHLDHVLPAVLQQCQDLHLLTVATSAQQEGDLTTRLAHDTFAPLVREEFDVSDKPGQRARRILNNRAIDWEGDAVGTPLDATDLALVEQGVGGTRSLSPAESRLLEASCLERSKRLRLQRTLKIAGSVAVLIIAILAVVAGVSRNKEKRSALAARKSLGVARNAVDEMLAKVGSEGLKNVPQVEQVRTALLNKAKELYSELSEEQGDSNSLRHEQAKAHYSLGEIHRMMEQREDATREYQQGIADLRSLIDCSPSEPQYRLDLATTYNKFGYMLSSSKIEGDKTRAEEMYVSALEQFESLDEEPKSRIEFQTQKALTLINRGVLHRALNQTADARKKFDEVIELLSPYQTQDASSEAVKECLMYLAFGHNNRAAINDESSPAAVARSITDYNAALKIAKLLLETYPKDRELELEYATWSNNLALEYYKAKDFERARALNGEAHTLLEELAKAAPNVRQVLDFSTSLRAAIPADPK